MRFKTLLSILVVILGTSCGTDQASEEQTTVATPRISPDSLRQLYSSLQALDTDTLPLVQIKEQDKLYPVDEAPLDTAFYVFRQQLLQAVRQHDVFALLDAVAKDIQVSGATEPGVAGLVSHYGLTTEAADTLPIWPILKDMLELGGTFSPDQSVFTTPYYAATWPDRYSREDYAAIAGSGVRIRDAPNLNSTIVKTVSYDLVKFLKPTDKTQEIGGERHPWVEIELSGGQTGFVYGKFIGRPNDYRARFEQTGPQQWVMTQFLNGD